MRNLNFIYFSPYPEYCAVCPNNGRSCTDSHLHQNATLNNRPWPTCLLAGKDGQLPNASICHRSVDQNRWTWIPCLISTGCHLARCFQHWSARNRQPGSGQLPLPLAQRCTEHWSDHCCFSFFVQIGIKIQLFMAGTPKTGVLKIIFPYIYARYLKTNKAGVEVRGLWPFGRPG